MTLSFTQQGKRFDVHNVLVDGNEIIENGVTKITADIICGKFSYRFVENVYEFEGLDYLPISYTGRHCLEELCAFGRDCSVNVGDLWWNIIDVLLLPATCATDEFFSLIEDMGLRIMQKRRGFINYWGLIKEGNCAAQCDTLKDVKVFIQSLSSNSQTRSKLH